MKDYVEKYIRDPVPDLNTRRQSWEIAIGLQKMDELTVSSYLMETAREHIEGRIDITTAKLRIDSYHKAHGESTDIMEADMVSVRIAEILGEGAFSLRPQELISIHERLFTSIYDNVGRFRNCNVTNHEWILNGDTVQYSPHEIIASSLDYLFKEERCFSYDLPLQEAVRHIASFISGIWQIHPFAEGNTRTVAVFLVKYLQYLGVDFNGELFAYNSRYFRNALVRANYQDMKKGIRSTTVYLERFLDNLLFDAHHELKNRYMHVDYESGEKISIGDMLPVNLTLEESAVVRIIRDNPSITQSEIASRIGKSIPTVKNISASLQEKGIIRRVGGRRYGSWQVVETLATADDK